VILRDLASQLHCDLRGRGDVDVVRVSGLENAGPGDLSFVASPKYVSKLEETGATAVIVTPDLETPLPSLLSSNPYLTYARAAALLHPRARPEPGVDPSARVDPTAQIGEGVHVAPLAVIGRGVQVGSGSVIHAHVVLYEGVRIGADCLLHSGVQVREGCQIGDRVVIQNGAIIGGDGFGFARDQDGRYEKIPQIGIVVIEDDVEIGSLVAIDRASMHETRIKRGAKLDNFVQIGHSVGIGQDTVLAAHVGIAGSTQVGDRVIIAGQVGIVGHIKIGDGVIITAQTGVPRSVEPGACISGSPAIQNRQWLKSSAAFAKLPELQKRVRTLEQQLAALERASSEEE
jgi:UDP-3-O-[3-hydroxymyristoyl] glucosamine N-acyltransferase